VDREFGCDFAMQPQRHLEFAQGFDGLFQSDLAALDGIALLLQRLRDVLGRDRSEELIVLCEIVTLRSAIILPRSVASATTLASFRKWACRSCSMIFLLDSEAGTASRFGSR
jgi:hypothetical protein